MTTKKEDTSSEQKTQTTNEGEYLPPEKKEYVFSTNMEIKNVIPAESKNAIQLYSQMDEQLKSFFLYLQSAFPDSENIWNTPIVNIVDILQRSGVPSDHLIVSLITLFTLNSAHLENPIALELIDDSYAGAADIIRICTDFSPKHFLANLSGKITFDTLLKEREIIKGRAITGLDSQEFEKVKDKFNLFLKNQIWADERTTTTQYGNIPQRIEITGPTACVLITKNPKKIILTHPSFLRCYLQQSMQPVAYVSELSEQNRAILKNDCNLIKTSLERLQSQEVKIPYRDQIIQFLQGNRIARDKVETLLRMLRIITIINNSPPLSGNELLSTIRKINPEIVALAYGHPITPKKELTASKVDYYIFWKLMSGFIQNEDIYLTENQKRIFEVIKNHNEKALRTATMVDPNASKFEKLNIIAADNSPAWITQEQIFLEINKDGGEEIKSPSTLYNYIQALIDKDLIKGKQYTNVKNKKGYHITTWEIADTIQLPQPSEIDHPMMQEKIKIVNPLTGEIEEV